MAGQSSLIAFADVPLEEARRIGRGPHMDPQFCLELRTRIPSRSDQAVRMTILDGTSPTTMKNRILRVAAELGMPATIRRVPGGLRFWRSSDADDHQAREIANRLQTAQRRQTRQGRRRRASRAHRYHPATPREGITGGTSRHRTTHATQRQTAVLRDV
jgi:hypothetical protein